jgi:hypothetical protein
MRPSEVIWAYWNEVMVIEEDAELHDPVYLGSDMEEEV